MTSKCFQANDARRRRAFASCLSPHVVIPKRSSARDLLLPFSLRCHPEPEREGPAFAFRLVGQPPILLFTILNHNQQQQNQPQPAANTPAPIPRFRLPRQSPPRRTEAGEVSSVTGGINCGKNVNQRLGHPPSGSTIAKIRIFSAIPSSNLFLRQTYNTKT